MKNESCTDEQGRLPVGTQSVAYRRWDSAHVPGLFFVESSEHNIAYAEHLHDALEIIWVRSGASELVCRGRRYPLRAGDAVVIAPNEVHGGGAHDFSWFSFSTLHLPRPVLGELITMAGGDAEAALAAPTQLLTGDRAATLYRQLVGGLPETYSYSDQMICLLSALGGLFRTPSSPRCLVVPVPVRHPGVEKVRTLMRESFTEHLDVDSLAHAAGLHQRYLISLFKAATGMPPHQYQIALRVEYARALLDKDVSLSNIASAAGFADQSHFNRLFKRTYQMTPGRFRDSTRHL